MASIVIAIAVSNSMDETTKFPKPAVLPVDAARTTIEGNKGGETKVPETDYGIGFCNFYFPPLNQPVCVLVLGNLAMKSFAELTGKEKSTERPRWICVPAARRGGCLPFSPLASSLAS
jgi:hypothetical protein